MANIQLLVPLILKWEGGYVNDPADRGGPTNRGVTLATWKQQGYDKNGDGKIDVEDLKLINKEDLVERILRPHYWNRWQADRINSQALANILVDWVWGSGRWGITIPQGILSVPADGIAGEKTLWAVNNYPDPEGLFEKIKQVRNAYLNMICIDRPANRRFLKGWLNRLNDFRWIPVVLLFCVTLSCRTAKTERLKQTTIETVDSSHVATMQRVKGEGYRVKGETVEGERQRTEIITAVFDTLDSKPVLKKLRIKRTVYDRTIQAVQQIENQTAETETQVERYRVKGEGYTVVDVEKKVKPAGIPAGWWIVGGVSAALVLLFGVWKWK